MSHKATEVVRATLPAVGAAIGDITPLFYKKMFAAHPELERDLFNRGNQASGEQQKALAGSIATYATLLITPGAPPPRELISRIAHKHASLGVTAEQYLIVYEHLFAAIAEVLGSAVTSEVAEAWTEVYWDMANTLIEAERGLYRAASVEDGDVWRTVDVVARRYESADAVSFVLAGADEAALPPFLPGQYISVGVTLPDGGRQIRQYSLSAAPRTDRWRITVKRIAQLEGDGGVNQPAGEVSNYLYNNVFEGDQLQVSLPFGDVTLHGMGTEPLVFITAGIGCTPVMSMLGHLAESGSERRVTVVHADRNKAAHAFRDELKTAVDQLPTAVLYRWYEDLGNRAETDSVRSGFVDLSGVDIPADAHVYLCGPLPFMQAVRAGLRDLDVAADRVHYEVFGPDAWLAS
nr:globin domain-containing protein [Hoyosella altamirensis]